MKTILLNPGERVPEFSLEGALDTLEAPAFQETVLAAYKTGETPALILDCSDMPYLTSTGLRALMTIGKTVKAGGGEMIICGLTGLARNIYLASGFGRVFPPEEDRAAARRRLGEAS